MAQTMIFQNHKAFTARKDKTINGVSPEFAAARPYYESDNQTNVGCWNCSDCWNCSSCSNCSICIACQSCSYTNESKSCSYCSNCTFCINCYNCNDCSDCDDVSHRSNYSNNKYQFVKEMWNNTLIIPQIHQRILEATSKPNALNMDYWHSCKTTHCLAGWVVTLAGKAGRRLEKLTSTPFAAMMIYKLNSPIYMPVTTFFGNNEKTLADIHRCAKEEETTLNIHPLSNLTL